MRVWVNFDVTLTPEQIATLSEMLGWKASETDAENFFWAEGYVGGLRKLDQLAEDAYWVIPPHGLGEA